MTLRDNIGRNLATIRARIGDIARATHRDPNDVTLIAVSKTQPLEAVEAAVNAGQVHFGENTVQDALTKIPHLANRGLIWHFIGHLQSNKAKFLPGNFHWLHSIDSRNLAQRVSRLAHERDLIIDSLIEVNITRDPNKQGVLPEMLFGLIESLLEQNLPGLRLRGLMAMGPHPATESGIRNAFAQVRRLRDEAQQRFALQAFDQLSMGMSGDYAEAIREGSTLVRIGTAIFGKRDYR